jgi:hypothetical protein
MQNYLRTCRTPSTVFNTKVGELEGVNMVLNPRKVQDRLPVEDSMQVFNLQ